MIILQNSVGACEALTAISQHVIDNYCRHHGYDHRLTHITAPKGLPAQWSKIDVVTQAMAGIPDGQLCAWMDADGCVNPRRMTIDLSGMLPEGFDIGLCERSWGTLDRWNTGVFAVRNTVAVRAFFERVMRLGPVAGRTDLAGEQPRMNHELASSGLRIFNMPATFNSYPGTWRKEGARLVRIKEPLIRMFHGLRPASLIAAQMRAFLQEDC